MALSRKKVDEIVRKFAKLKPYHRKLVPGSILKVHKLNWDHNKRRRQLYGYAIAAKRYALYTKTKDDIEIIEPKSTGAKEMGARGNERAVSGTICAAQAPTSKKSESASLGLGHPIVDPVDPMSDQRSTSLLETFPKVAAA